MVNKYLVGFLTLVVLVSSIYIMLPDNVRLDVGKTYSTFKVYENNSWVVAGVEYTKIYDRTTLMRANDRVVNYSIKDNTTTIQRFAYFKDGIVAVDTYFFDGNNKDKELIPVSHNIQILNAKNKIFQYEIGDILYTGETREITSPFGFGHKMMVEWEDGSYYSKVFQQKVASDKVIIKYKIDSNDFSKDVRLYDPAGDYWETNSTINASLPDIGVYSDPSVFDMNGTRYMISASGVTPGPFYGFKWTGTQWVTNSTINNSLPANLVHTRVDVFNWSGRLFMIAGSSSQGFYGFDWTGGGWETNSTINASLPNLGTNTGGSIFLKDSTLFGIFNANIAPYYFGYNYTGTNWQKDWGINASLPITGSIDNPEVFYMDDEIFMIMGLVAGTFNGYNWTGSAWQKDWDINASLPDVGIYASPSIFNDSSGNYYMISGASDGKFYGFDYVMLPHTIPYINLDAPLDNSNFSTNYVLLSVTPFDGENATNLNVSIWDNVTGVWALYQYNETAYNNTNTTFNRTGIPAGIAKYVWNANVTDPEGMSAFNSSNRTFGIDTGIIGATFRMFFNGIEGNNSVELGSNLTLMANSTVNRTICVDIVHPDYGVNYQCLENNTQSFNFLIEWFNKSVFSDDTTSKVFNFTGTGVNNATFTGHQYDDVSGMEFNISGTNEPLDVIIFKANTTMDMTNQSQFERLIDRYFDGVLRGSNVNVFQFWNNVNETNLTFNTAGEQLVYFLIDDSLATNVGYTFLIDIIGGSVGVAYQGGNSTTGNEGFANYSDIDSVRSNAQLDPSGVIMAQNVTNLWASYDDFDDSSLNQSKWSNGSCIIGPSTSCVTETGGKMKVYQNLVGASGSNEVISTDLSRFESDNITFSVIVNYTGSEHTTGSADGTAYVNFGGITVWNLTVKDTVNTQPSEEAHATISFQLTKVNKTYWKARMWGKEIAYWNSTYSVTQTYSGTTRYIPLVSNSTANVLHFKTSASSCAYCGPADMYLYVDYVNRTLWTRQNSSVISNSIFDSDSDINQATIWLSGRINGYGEQNFTVYMSADDGVNWENGTTVYTTGASGTFSNFLSGHTTFANPGQNLRFRIDFNSTNWNFNETNQIYKVNISIPSSDPSNISIDFGDDGIVDQTLNGVINGTNGTLTVNLSYINISTAFNESNKWTNVITHKHVYKIPVSINTSSRGFITVNNVNLTYNPNPIRINITNVSNTLGNSTNFTTFRIPIGAFNLSDQSVNVTVNDVSITYAGGNQSILFKIHDSLNLLTSTSTFTLTYYYSSFIKNLPYTWTDYVFFLPSTNSSKNVSAYGQTSSMPLLRINMTNYGGKDANLSLSVNQTYSCLVLTQNGNATKPASGSIVNTTHQGIQSQMGYLTNKSVWLWADLTNCNASDQSILSPNLEIRSSCHNCLGGGQ